MELISTLRTGYAIVSVTCILDVWCTHVHVGSYGRTHFILYTCTCRAYVNCGHVMYSGQCTSIVGAVASAAVSSDGSFSH